MHKRDKYAAYDRARLARCRGKLLVGTLDYTVEVELTVDKTAVRFTYKVGGYMEFPADQIAPAVDSMLSVNN